MREYIIKFALWLVRKLGLKMFHYTRFENLICAASEPIQVEELKKDMSGEYKRHQVYARLIKRFPDVPRRDIGLAIELAVREL